MEAKKKSIIILDANAFISMKNVKQLSIDNRLVTTSDVVAELKDTKSKYYFQSIPFEIQELNFNDKSLQLVKNFAKKTGDVGSLSDIDMQLIALTHTLYVQNDQQAKLRRQPPPLVEKEDLELSDESSYSSAEEEEQTALQNQPKQVKKEDQQKGGEDKDEEWVVVPSKKKKQEEQQESDDDDQEAWITPENYSKKIAEMNSTIKQLQQPEDQNQIRISIVSADFAIQNVATQMGIRLLSLDGRKITQIKRFLHECYLCWKKFKIDDNKIKLCNNCGYNTLSKISFSLDSDGNMILHRKKGWKPNEKVLQFKERKFEEQQKNKKHQHARRKKKPSIFES